MARFTVRVVDNNQKGWEGISVALGFTGFLRGMTDTVYTDSDGRAEFEGYDEGEVEIFIRGRNYGIYSYEDGDEVTITK